MNSFADDGSDDGSDDGEDEENSIELKFGGIKVEMNLNEFQETWSFEE